MHHCQVAVAFPSLAQRPFTRTYLVTQTIEIAIVVVAPSFVLLLRGYGEPPFNSGCLTIALNSFDLGEARATLVEKRA